MPELVRFRPPHLVLVLHAGHWRRGLALAGQRSRDGWRLLVSYRVEHEIGPVTYLHWRPAAEVRPDDGAPLPPAPVLRHPLIGQGGW